MSRRSLPKNNSEILLGMEIRWRARAVFSSGEFWPWSLSYCSSLFHGCCRNRSRRQSSNVFSCFDENRTLGFSECMPEQTGVWARNAGRQHAIEHDLASVLASADVTITPAPGSDYSPSGLAPLLHAEKIDVEDQRGSRRDDAAGAARAIAQVRRNDQRALAADMHGGDAFVPALDDLALADRERKRLVPVERAVEFLALFAVDEQPASIVDRHRLAGLRHGSGARLDVDDAQATRRGYFAGGSRGPGSQER